MGGTSDSDGILVGDFNGDGKVDLFDFTFFLIV